MPVFNPNISYLSESVESILSQTYDEIELIVVLDKVGFGKDEIILAKLEEFRDDHRLKLISNQHRLGFTKSLNRGIKVSKGEYIGRMDADDISSANRIQEQVDFVQRKKVDLVGCWSYVIDKAGQVLGCLSPPSEWPMIRKYLLFHNPFLHSSILFTRRIIGTIGMYRSDFEPSEDYEFYLRAFSRGFKGANIAMYLHSLREHSSSMIRGNRWKENRFTYLKCKLSAVLEYHFNKPRDIFYLGITPLSFSIKPSKALFIKSLFGLYKPSAAF